MKIKLFLFTLVTMITTSHFAMEAPHGKRKAEEVSSDFEQENIDPTQELIEILESKWEPEDEQEILNEIEDLLLEGADPNAKNYANMPVLLLATRTWNSALVELLLEYDVNLDAQTDKGETALHFAVAQLERFGGSTDIVRILLAADANPNIQDMNGENPLAYAIRLDNTQAIDLLLKAGADPNMKDRVNGETSLHYAVIFKNLAIIQRLLEAGADPNIPDNNGNTPLLFIIKNPNREIAQMLLQAGANPHITNNKGESGISLLKQLINKTHGEYFLQIMEWILRPETLPKIGFEKLTSEKYQLIEPILKEKI